MTLSLADLRLKTEYRSDTDDLIADFYLPCLGRTRLYRRAVGFFTSRGLSVAAQGITALIEHGGRMLLVASPLLDPDDLEAIERGYSAREDIFARSLLRQIESSPDTLVRDRLGYLAWLIAEDRLEVRIAVRYDDENRPCQGTYHEKLGLFSDEHGNVVAFTGSPNETSGGLVDNFEATDVFCSWADADGRVERKVANFERLWLNQTSRLSVMPFPEAAREQLLRYRPKSRPESETSTWVSQAVAEAPPPKGLWKHQVEAILAWEAHARRGILSMATGSGKTRTALAAAERCPGLRLLVIAAPRAGLVEQWRDELAAHTRFREPVLVYESAARWQEMLFARMRAARKGSKETVVVVGTLHSLSGRPFETVLEDCGHDGRALLIADEVHNAGAPTFREMLRPVFDWRLGLSATPARHFDEVGTQALQKYFGATVYTYDLRKALGDGLLCPYRYHVYPAYLADEEYEEYQRLTRQIVALRASGAEDVTLRSDNRVDGDSADVDRLLFRRARVLKKCGAKLVALLRALDAHPMRRGLIYCADNEQLTDVSDAIRQRGSLFLIYTAQTSNEQRRAALSALAAGHIPMLVAIDCLDEGVDVPAVDEAIILASSSNKRQFIQRRGRILRSAPGKTVATLVDIIALPPLSTGREARGVLRGELSRVKEMAELASNRYDALRAVARCAEPFGVFLSELLSGEGDG